MGIPVKKTILALLATLVAGTAAGGVTSETEASVCKTCRTGKCAFTDYEGSFECASRGDYFGTAYCHESGGDCHGNWFPPVDVYGAADLENAAERFAAVGNTVAQENGEEWVRACGGIVVERRYSEATLAEIRKTTRSISI